MLSKKLTNVLQAKSTFSKEEIQNLSESEGWKWIYANSAPKKPRQTGPEICFTGFDVTDKALLALLAKEAGLAVVGSVTKGLIFLCTGENPGESKIEKARAQKVQFLDLADFKKLVESGELPKPVDNTGYTI